MGDARLLALDRSYFAMGQLVMTLHEAGTPVAMLQSEIVYSLFQALSSGRNDAWMIAAVTKLRDMARGVETLAHRDEPPP